MQSYIIIYNSTYSLPTELRMQFASPQLKMGSNNVSELGQINTKMQQQINAIHFKMNRKMTKMTSTKNREEEEDNKQKPTLIKMTREDAFTFIENDRQTYMKKKMTWKQMDKTTQWKLITDYVDRQLLTVSEKRQIKSFVKKLFMSNQLINVQYCNGADSIIKLNVNSCLKVENIPKEIAL